MNRFWWPAGGVAAAGLALVAASLVPVQQPVSFAQPDDDRARVAVVCPIVAGDANPTAVAAGSPAGDVTTLRITDPDRPTSAGAAFVLDTTADEAVVATAPRLKAFSATTRTAAPTGSDRGLSMMSCGRPRAAQWFTGVLSSTTATADLVLMNADAQDAAVDVTVYGVGGRLAAPGSRGIIVPAHSRRVVPLGPLFTSPQPTSLRVTTSAGRVAAAVRQRMLSGGSSAGGDWLPPTADPATSVVIAGLPAGRGTRDLVVVNPGERTASVTLQVLGADGPTAVAGLHVEHGNAPPLGEKAGQAAVRVAQDQHPVRAFGGQHVVAQGEHVGHPAPGGGRRDVQLHIRPAHAEIVEEEVVQARVQVLTRVHEHMVDRGVQPLDHGAEADDLRPGAHDGEDLHRGTSGSVACRVMASAYNPSISPA